MRLPTLTTKLGNDSAPTSRGGSRLSAAVVGLIAATVLLPALARARPVAATAVERTWMVKLLARLHENRAAMPVPVVNTENSLSRTVSWRFACPRGSRFDTVEIQVSTEQARWDAARSRDDSGRYGWSARLNGVGGRAKVVADNWIALDADYLAAQEAKPGLEGGLEAEATLYHELLHGELVMLAMGTKQWQKKACNKVLDLSHFAPSHEKIEPLVDEYRRRRRASLEGAGAASD